MKDLDMREASEYLINRPLSKGAHTLDKIRLLLERFENPQDKIKTIHLAGTNGKGSTSKMLNKAISSKNKTGMFNSPYIWKINEAISINGTDISDEDFINLVDRLKGHVEDLDELGYHLSYFEILTAMAYIHFYEKDVDFAIIETGLGGLVDSTNIIKKPIASVITTISMDHVDILGHSIEEIAYQKAGIIKEDTPVFVYPNQADVMKVIKKVAKEKNSPVFTFTKDQINIKEANDIGSIFDFMGYEDIRIKLLGKHQIYNAALAIMVLDYFKDDFSLDEMLIKDSLEKTENLGRLTTISKNPRVIVDGSHNKESIDALVETLKTFSYDKLIVGFSILKDKDYPYIIDKLSQIADRLVLTSIDNDRAFDIDQLSQITKKKFKDLVAIEDRKKAYQYSKSICGVDDLVLWCGSLYLISDIIHYQIDGK